MTRILCFGDLHLDAGTSHRADALADHEAALEQITDLAAGCDLVLFGGDAYHRPHASDAARHVLRRFLRRLDQRGVPLVGIIGNASHDLYGTDRETALELEDDRPRVYISRHPEVIHAAGVSVCTLPSTPVGRLVAQQDGGDRAQVYQQAADLLLETARGLAARAESDPCLLLGHFSVTGASLPNGLPVADLNEPILDLAALGRLGFDAMVFSHIHNPEVLATGGPALAFYTGSPICLSFGEAHVAHGVWILDTDLLQAGDDGALEFVPLADRRFVTIDVDLLTDEAFALAQTGEFDETDRIAAAVAAEFPLDGAIVRVRYRASEAQHRRINQASIRRLIADAGGRCYQVAADVIRDSRARTSGVDESLDPLAAVAAWCDANAIPPEQARLLADLTTELLAEVAA